MDIRFVVYRFFVDEEAMAEPGFLETHDRWDAACTSWLGAVEAVASS